MKDKKIMRALIIKPHGVIEEMEIDTRGDNLRALVDGYIEMPCLSNLFRENDILAVINEEGKLLPQFEGKESLMLLDNTENGNVVIDVVLGDIILLGHNIDRFTSEDEEVQNEDFKPLTDEQVDIIRFNLLSGEFINKDGNRQKVFAINY